MSPFRIAASMPRSPRFVSSAWWPLARVALLAAPLLLPLVVPLRLLGPFAAWLLTSGRWLVVAAVAASILSLARVAFDRHAGRPAAARLDAIPVRLFAPAVFALGFLAM